MNYILSNLRKLLEDHKPPKRLLIYWNIPDPTKPGGHDRGVLPISPHHEQSIRTVLERAYRNGGNAFCMNAPEPPKLEIVPFAAMPAMQSSISLYPRFGLGANNFSVVVPSLYEGGGGFSASSVSLDALIASKRVEYCLVVKIYAQRIASSKRIQFRVERRMMRIWDKQIKQILGR